MEIDLTNAKPCPECRQCLTTDPKCSYCNERDRLRAELTRALQCVTDQALTILRQRADSRRPTANTIALQAVEPWVKVADGLQKRLTAASDTIAGLREALERLVRDVEPIKRPYDLPKCQICNRSAFHEPDCPYSAAIKALARTPSQHRARIVAAGLREVSRLVDDCSRETILREAERLERGE